MFSLLDSLLDAYLCVYIWCYHICQTEHYQLLYLEQPEAVPSTSDSSGPSALQTEQPGSFRPQAPNLAGAVEFNDVKTLLKEWITTISGMGCHASDDLACITRKFLVGFLYFLPLLFLSLDIFHSNLEVSLHCNLGVT